jgi:antitoxin component of MazEF toxin-antitoxin module
LYGKDSLGITLPKQYLRALGIEKGDEILIQITNDGALRIIPLKSNPKGVRVDSSEAPVSSSSDPASADQAKGGLS